MREKRRVAPVDEKKGYRADIIEKKVDPGTHQPALQQLVRRTKKRGSSASDRHGPINIRRRAAEGGRADTQYGENCDHGTLGVINKGAQEKRDRRLRSAGKGTSLSARQEMRHFHPTSRGDALPHNRLERQHEKKKLVPVFDDREKKKGGLRQLSEEGGTAALR